MKRKFFILWLAGIVGTAAVLPYAFTLQHDVIAKVTVPFPLIVLASIAQTAVLLAIAIFFGQKLSSSLRLTTLALCESTGSIKEKLPGMARLAIPWGAASAVAIALVDMLFAPFTPQLTVTTAHVAVWKTLLASLYGGTVEEILLRLFVMTLIAWILGKIFRSKEPAKNNLIMWTAITLAAIIFGLGHLPVTSALTAVTPIVVLRAVVLNGIAGLVFGWLFWKKGLETAFIAHFTADIILLTVIPAIFK